MPSIAAAAAVVFVSLSRPRSLISTFNKRKDWIEATLPLFLRELRLFEAQQWITIHARFEAPLQTELSSSTPSSRPRHSRSIARIARSMRVHPEAGRCSSFLTICYWQLRDEKLRDRLKIIHKKKKTAGRDVAVCFCVTLAASVAGFSYSFTKPIHQPIQPSNVHFSIIQSVYRVS